MKAADVARQQIEWVFGLTGGELSAGPWAGYAYWYEGLPSYAAQDYPDRFKEGVEYRTVIHSGLFSAPPTTLDGFAFVQSFSSSGECECPGQSEDGDSEDDGDSVVCVTHCADGETTCALCGESLGESHGYIYLGDGECEAVYRREVPVEE
jgi:hypothetical protein